MASKTIPAHVLRPAPTLTPPSPKRQQLTAIAGTLKDRARLVKIAASSKEFPEIDVALTKATNHDRRPPKEKHVQTLLQAVAYGLDRQPTVLEYLVRQLVKRMERAGLDWLVVLKLLMVFHRLAREADGRWQRALDARLGRLGATGLLDRSTFRDASSPEAQAASGFVRAYSAYLAERSALFRALGDRDLFAGPPTAARADAAADGRGVDFATMDPREVLDKLPAAQACLQRACACVPAGVARSSEPVLWAAARVAGESRLLHRACGDGVVRLCDSLLSLDRDDARRALRAYRAALSADRDVSDYWRAARTLGGPLREVDLPRPEPLPEAFAAQLEDYIRSGAAAVGGSVGQGAASAAAPAATAAPPAPAVTADDFLSGEGVNGGGGGGAPDYSTPADELVAELGAVELDGGTWGGGALPAPVATAPGPAAAPVASTSYGGGGASAPDDPFAGPVGGPPGGGFDDAFGAPPAQHAVALGPPAPAPPPAAAAVADPFALPVAASPQPQSHSPTAWSPQPTPSPYGGAPAAPSSMDPSFPPAGYPSAAPAAPTPRQPRPAPARVPSGGLAAAGAADPFDFGLPRDRATEARLAAERATATRGTPMAAQRRG